MGRILTITQATQDIFGSWDVTVEINNREYKYTLNTHDYKRARVAYNHNNRGRMLNILKGVI